MTCNADPPAPYDFRSPSRLATSVEQRFAEWQRGVCKLFAEHLNHHLPFDVKFGFVEVDPRSTRKVLSSLPEGTAAFQFKVGDESLPCLFTYPQPLLLLIVNGMLGDTSTELPASRELSHVERSLSEIVAEELASSVAEAFVGDAPVSCELVGYEARPERTRIFPRDGISIVSVFEADLASESQSCQFIFPYSVVDLLPMGNRTGNLDSSETRKQLESILLTVPLTLAVQLGSADLKISELSKLRPGDIVMLDQSAGEPLQATIDDKPHFHVWAGKVGHRRAIQIAKTE